VLHTGVVITADEATFSPTETLPGPGAVVFCAEKQIFEVGDLKPIRCDIGEEEKQ